MTKSKTVTMQLSPEEARAVEDRRELLKASAYRREGVLMAADRLEELGGVACGGNGEMVNMATGKRWGEEFFAHAKMLRDWVQA